MTCINNVALLIVLKKNVKARGKNKKNKEEEQAKVEKNKKKMYFLGEKIA